MKSDLIPCISLYRPWSQWVELGWKTIETRLHSRFKGLRGRRIGIHHGLKWDAYAIEAARPYLTRQQIERTQEELISKPGGYVSCTFEVTDAHWIQPSWTIHQMALIDCQVTCRFGLWLENIQHIEDVPMTGKQGIWYVDRDGRKV